jgi:hypothetical protein
MQTIHLPTIAQDQIQDRDRRAEYPAKVAISERMALNAPRQPSCRKPASAERHTAENNPGANGSRGCLEQGGQRSDLGERHAMTLTATDSRVTRRMRQI